MHNINGISFPFIRRNGRQWGTNRKWGWSYWRGWFVPWLRKAWTRQDKAISFEEGKKEETRRYSWFEMFNPSKAECSVIRFDMSFGRGIFLCIIVILLPEASGESEQETSERESLEREDSLHSGGHHHKKRRSKVKRKSKKGKHEGISMFSSYFNVRIIFDNTDTTMPNHTLQKRKRRARNWQEMKMEV